MRVFNIIRILVVSSCAETICSQVFINRLTDKSQRSDLLTNMNYRCSITNTESADDCLATCLLAENCNVLFYSKWWKTVLKRCVVVYSSAGTPEVGVNITKRTKQFVQISAGSFPCPSEASTGQIRVQAAMKLSRSVAVFVFDRGLVYQLKHESGTQRLCVKNVFSQCEIMGIGGAPVDMALQHEVDNYINLYLFRGGKMELMSLRPSGARFPLWRRDPPTYTLINVTGSGSAPGTKADDVLGSAAASVTFVCSKVNITCTPGSEGACYCLYIFFSEGLVELYTINVVPATQQVLFERVEGDYWPWNTALTGVSAAVENVDGTGLMVFTDTSYYSCLWKDAACTGHGALYGDVWAAG